MIYIPLLFGLFCLCPMLSAIAVRRSLSVRWQLSFIGFCLCYGAFPLLVSWVSSRLSGHFGCEYFALSIQCPSNLQLEEFLSGVVFSPWLIMVTFPSAVSGIVGLFVSIYLTTSLFRREAMIAHSSSSQYQAAAFCRSRRHRVFFGLFGAISQRWRLSLLGVRIVAVILLVALSVPTITVYLWCLLAFPLEPQSDRSS